MKVVPLLHRVVSGKVLVREVLGILLVSSWHEKGLLTFVVNLSSLCDDFASILRHDVLKHDLLLALLGEAVVLLCVRGSLLKLFLPLLDFFFFAHSSGLGWR